MKGLIDIPGIRVGHVSDYGAITGCTAILCEQGGVDIRGSATGTEEIATLDPGHVTDKVHGIVAGRRAFGLEAASGVRREGADRSGGDSLRSRDRPGRRVPLGRDGRSGRLGGKHGSGEGRLRRRGNGRDGRQAVRDEAGDEGRPGIVHGGAAGRCPGVEPRGGQRARRRAGPGDRKDRRGSPGVGEQPRVRRQRGADEERRARRPNDQPHHARGGRHQREANESGGEQDRATGGSRDARTIFPLNTMFDGDILFGLSIGDRTADVNTLGTAAAKAVAQAVLRAARLAKTLGGVPGLAGE